MLGTRLALPLGVDQQTSHAAWEREREALLGRRISEIGLTIHGSRIERLVDELYAELASKGIAFRPPVYLSDQWGCPDGTPLIGVPFYLVDQNLERIEAEMSAGVEDDTESMRYLRHECGHAVNYAFRLYERADWERTFGEFSRPYRERYRADPFSREYVRHILGWYAQKHPDEDFAETFAVWLTPDLDWRRAYEGWPARRKLEYVDEVMTAIRTLEPELPALTPEDLPVDAMTYTVAEHYAGDDERLPIEDARQFDTDLRRIFSGAHEAPRSEPARQFLSRHEREIVGRISYWTAEAPAVVRSLLRHLAARAEVLGLRVAGLEASTLIELTAFGTAVVMNYRYTRVLGRGRRARTDDVPIRSEA
ncbi:MAG TPA: hypothetical protein VF159_11310 [Gemmatimonadaceae bacterium]